MNPEVSQEFGQSQEFAEVPKKQPERPQESEQKNNGNRESEVQEYKEIAPADLKLSELNDESLDKEGREFKTAILDSLVDTNTYPVMNLEDLQRDFDLVVNALKDQYNNPSLAEVKALGRQKLRELVVEIVPPVEAPPRNFMLSETARNEFSKAMEELQKNLLAYEDPNKEKSGFFSKLKNLVGGSNGEDNSERFEGDLKILKAISNSPILNKEMLDYPLSYVDVENGNFGKGTLSTAIQFGVSNPQYFRYYVQTLSAVPLGKIYPDKLVQALEMVADGYGIESFTEEQSKQQFTTGTPFAARTASGGNYLKQNYYKTIKVKNVA